MRGVLLAFLISGCAGSEEQDPITSDSSSGDSESNKVVDAVTDVFEEHALFETEPFTCGNGTHDEGETCDDGNVKDGDGCSADCRLEGCANGDRVGFRDPAVFPNIAACGTETDYLTARDGAGKVCQTGWHMCALVPKELDTHLPDKVTPTEKFRAWIKSDDTSCVIRSLYTNLTCAGDASSIRVFNGTGSCASKLACTSGYRAVVDTNAWNVAVSGPSSACNAHVSAGCGFAGGSAVAKSLTLCCR